MSIKQNEHREAYHITNQNDYDSVVLEKDEEQEEKKEEEEEDEYDECDAEANLIITTLENIMKELAKAVLLRAFLDKKDIKHVVDTILSEKDKQELYNLYFSMFHDLPDNNSIKIYVLHLFNEICMPIKRNTEEFNALLKKCIEEENEYSEGDELSELDIEVDEATNDLSKSIL